MRLIESHELTTNQVNELLRAAAIGCLFIHDHTPTERARMLRDMFNAPQKERPIFLDSGDIGIIEND